MLFTTLTIIMLLSGVVCLLGIVFILRHMQVKNAANMCLVLFFMAAWAITGALEAGLTSHFAQMVVGRAAYVAYAFLPVSWAGFIVEFVTHRLQFKSPVILVLYGVSLVFILLNWFNPHQLFYTSIEYATLPNGSADTVFHYGPLFWMYTTYIYGVMVITAIWLEWKSREKIVSPVNAHIMLGAVFTPVVANLLYLLKVTYVDLAPVTFVLSVFLGGLLYRNEFFLRLPLSRRAIMDALDDGILLYNKNGDVVEMNQAAVRMLDLKNPKQYYEDAHAILAQWEVPLDVAGPRTDLQRFSHSEKGNAFYRLAYNTLPTGGRNSYTIVSLRDETVLHRAEERIRILEEYDEITGLYSRGHFSKMLESQIYICQKEELQLILMCFLVVGFDEYRSVYGSKFGKQLLRAIGQRLSWTLTQYSAIGRFSGDEFYLYRPMRKSDRYPATVARAMEQSMVDLFEEPLVVDGISVLVRLKIGLAICPQHGVQPDQLISNASLAMNHAANTDNYCAIYDDTMIYRQARLVQIRQQLYTALANKELSVVFHPQVDTRTQRVVGVEALIRWKNPELDIVPPDEFIPVAEDTGLIREIGYWVLRKAIFQLAEWHTLGFTGLRIGVNISLGQLRDSHFADYVLSLLDASQLNPTCLELEITESMALFPEALTQNHFPQLRAKGVRIAMDDFGMGHSSLSYIKLFKLDTLKIDRVLSHDILNNPTSEAMIRSVRDLCETLQIETVVEYVESREQIQLLTSLGCHLIQGYIFSPPLDAGGCTLFLKEMHKKMPSKSIPFEKSS